ncbi:regulator of chromosome condensation protein, putative [Theileria equi strain WA]|uniref:Regulator of chromosome condensation protein, putative n=1 Tax=Theileria equi strain WA TaxID=1537102 RepID=L1LCW4_THEEQ|nr:regulator of chromosome condensation protein, putative [Theileria equi strain WA]EKX73252.1 regulator of chromosome condensation protein, putative [Theileria equi strain WA]|eukprot:XP_004832704.1 regulator of chromosome condensation protein, putative [Theileria equi strain WA]
MATNWTCPTCMVSNQSHDEFCLCCGTATNSSYTQEPTNDHDEVVQSPPKKQKVTSYLDNPGRVRMSFNVSDLKTTTVFIVGSSEIDQIPSSCCDTTKEGDGSEFSSLYECALPTPILSIPRVKIVSVSCGALHTALLTANGDVYTFGCNDMGALGRKVSKDETPEIPDSEPMKVNISQPIKKVTCGDNHTLFLTYNGTVLIVGSFKDSDGPIGIPDYDNYETLTKLEYIDNPTIVPCEVEGAYTISDICSGENHCVLLPQGGKGVYTFGSNEFSQLMIWGDQIQTYTDNSPDLSDDKTKRLALTWPQFRTLTDLEIVTEGDSDTGRRKRPRTSDESVDKIFTGYCTTFIQTKNLVKLYGVGRNAQGEVGCGSDEMIVKIPKEITLFEGHEITQLSGGQFFTMALVEDAVYTWGNNDYIGHDIDTKEGKQTTPLKLQGFDEIPIEHIFNGADSCFAITYNADLYAWGSGQNYILGNGKDYIFQKTPDLVPASHFPSSKPFGGKGGSQHTVFLCSKRRVQK